MQKLLWISGCLSLLLAISACKKEEVVTELTITGTVMDPNLSQTIGGAEVRLSVQEVTGGVWSSGYRTLGNMTTGSNGAYTFTFEKPNAVDYKVEISKNLYFSNETTIDPELVIPSTPYHSTQNIYSQSWLTINYENVAPVDSLDELRFQQMTGVNDCSICCTGTTLFLNGEFVDTTTTCLLYGGQMARFNYWVTKGGNITSFVDSIYCAPFDTAVYQVSY